MNSPLFDDFEEPDLNEAVWENGIGTATQPGHEDEIAEANGYRIEIAAEESELRLCLPGNARFNQPMGGINLRSREEFLYGTFSGRMKAAKCEPEAETISSLFTYFDHPDCEVSEIDIEILGSEPQTIYLTIWTMSDAKNKKERRCTRVIDLRSGTYKQTALTPEGFLKREDLFSPPPFPNTGEVGFTIPDFDASARFYTYAFTWKRESIEYCIEHEGEMKTIWRFEGAEHIPQKKATLRTNLWWSSVHWDRPAESRAPLGPTVHTFDWIQYEPPA